MPPIYLAYITGTAVSRMLLLLLLLVLLSGQSLKYSAYN